MEHESDERKTEEHMNENPSEKELTIKIRKQDLWKYATFLFAALFVISLFWNPLGNDSGGGTGNVVVPTPTPTPIPTQPSQVKVTIDETDPILGDENAEVSIVEFSDFQCPFCARAASGSLADLKNSDYFKNGQVNLIYKHFPLNSIHPDAQKAAEASVCADNQGKFWEYHDTLFVKGAQALDINSLKSYASQLGLNTADFDKCLDDGEAAKKVASDLQQAAEAGGRGTPYFVIVNKQGETQTVSGAVPWANFESAIQSLL